MRLLSADHFQQAFLLHQDFKGKYVVQFQKDLGALALLGFDSKTPTVKASAVLLLKGMFHNAR